MMIEPECFCSTSEKPSLNGSWVFNLGCWISDRPCRVSAELPSAEKIHLPQPDKGKRGGTEGEKWWRGGRSQKEGCCSIQYKNICSLPSQMAAPSVNNVVYSKLKRFHWSHLYREFSLWPLYFFGSVGSQDTATGEQSWSQNQCIYALSHQYFCNLNMFFTAMLPSVKIFMLNWHG